MEPLALEQACLSFLWSMLSLQVWCAQGYSQPRAAAMVVTVSLLVTSEKSSEFLIIGHV